MNIIQTERDNGQNEMYSADTDNQFTQNRPVELMWTDIRLETNKGKVLLKNISGKVEPGSMVALMGSSGAGKTTLMNSLTGRLSSDLELSGSVLINGEERSNDTWGNISAYVSQVFYAYGNQTVEETLKFVYKAKGLTGDIHQEVADLLGLLSLSSSKSTYVNRLSGGERIRLSVGLELIGNPSVIFLDEPLSGLDSYNAINILDFLKKLTQAGKTLIVTIHQPSYKMVRYFDKLYLMGQGNVLFDGSVDECVAHFNNMGYQLPENTNPTDFFLDVTAIDSRTPENTEESMEKIRRMAEEWANVSPGYVPEYTGGVAHSSEYSGCFTCKGNAGKLYVRSIYEFFRNKTQFALRIVSRIAVAILFFCTYWMVGKKDALSVYTFRGIFTFLTLNEVFGIAGPLYNLFNQEQKIITRERQSGFYTGYTAYVAKYASELTILLIIEIPFLLLIYFLTGFYITFFQLLQFMLIMFCLIVFGLALGLTVSIIAPTANSAQALGATLSILFILYSGAFIAPNDLPSWLSWLIYISPVQYSFRAIIQTQSNNRTFAIDEGSDMTLDSEALVKSFGLESLNMTICVIVVLAVSVFFGLVGALRLHRKTRNQLRIKSK